MSDETTDEVAQTLKKATGIPPWAIWLVLGSAGSGAGLGGLDVFSRVRDLEGQVTTLKIDASDLRAEIQDLEAADRRQSELLDQIDRNVLRLCIATKAGCDSE